MVLHLLSPFVNFPPEKKLNERLINISESKLINKLKLYDEYIKYTSLNVLAACSHIFSHQFTLN